MDKLTMFAEIMAKRTDQMEDYLKNSIPDLESFVERVVDMADRRVADPEYRKLLAARPDWPRVRKLCETFDPADLRGFLRVFSAALAIHGGKIEKIRVETIVILMEGSETVLADWPEEISREDS